MFSSIYNNSKVLGVTNTGLAVCGGWYYNNLVLQNLVQSLLCLNISGLSSLAAFVVDESWTGRLEQEWISVK